MFVACFSFHFNVFENVNLLMKFMQLLPRFFLFFFYWWIQECTTKNGNEHILQLRHSLCTLRATAVSVVVVKVHEVATQTRNMHSLVRTAVCHHGGFPMLLTASPPPPLKIWWCHNGTPSSKTHVTHLYHAHGKNTFTPDWTTCTNIRCT